MKAAQCEGLQSEREKLQLSHELSELQATPATSSKAARSEVPEMASQREESRRRYLPLDHQTSPPASWATWHGRFLTKGGWRLDWRGRWRQN